MRRKAVWGSGIAIAAVLLSSMLFAGCGGDLVRQGETSSYLIIQSLLGSSGAKAGEDGNVLSSDVITIVDGSPTIFEDAGTVTLRLAMRDPLTTPSPLNQITITRYRVVYTRADGRNTAGVDVPHPFDGMVTATVAGTTSFGFTLVRIQAKQEAPLQALAGDGGAGVISTLAEVTFYGHDQTGTAVAVTGHIGVNFADWGDPD